MIMRLLIAGRDGQLGRAVVAESEHRGIEYIAPPEAQFDISNPKAVNDTVWAARPTHLINCAAYNLVDKAEEDWRTAAMVNGLGVRNLAVACTRQGVELLHCSTDYVFSGEKGEPYTIMDDPSPINLYGRSKLLGERLLQFFGSRFYLVRLSWVFGNGTQNFLHKLREWAENNRRLEIVDDQVSSPSFVDDLAPALLDLMDTGVYGLYHLCNTGHCSRYQWARYALELMGWKGELIPVKSDRFPTPARRPAFSAMDTFPFEETVGYKPPTWQEATERFLQKEAQ